MSIVLDGVSKRFGNLLVVNNLSLKIEDGELFVLLGASGSGKSTVLRMIAGLARPDSGKIELKGQDVTKLPPQQRGTGFVFQNYSLFRHMTVAENVEFGLKVRKVPTERRRERRDELLDLVDLGGLGNRYANQLSGGQQQRVALARALAYEPSVILLDEPFGALDVKIRGQLRRTLKEIQEKLKLTAILVTHDQEEAFELADRIGVIERGNMIEVGTPEQLYHTPKTEFAANFIGGKNVLIGRVEGGVIKLGSTVLPVPENLGAYQTRVRILFRPETVLLKPEPFEENSGVFVLGQGKVLERVFVGSHQRIRVEVEPPQGIRPYSQDFGERTIEVDAVQPSDANHENSYGPGQLLWVGFKNYHVLQTRWPKVLMCTDESPVTKAVTEFGCYLSEKARSSSVLFSVVDSPEETAKIREKLETIRQSYLDKVKSLDVRIRLGESEEQILLETQEGNYEIVVMGHKAKESLGRHVRRMLHQMVVPVVIVQTPRPTISRVLICSAVGEPGKADVRVGGRLARVVGAGATVLHVANHEPEDQLRRIDIHLKQARTTLETFGVKSEIKIGMEPAVEAILEEAENGDYDLIVIGAPPLDGAYGLLWQDFTGRIVTGTTRSVMIVPMTE